MSARVMWRATVVIGSLTSLFLAGCASSGGGMMAKKMTADEAIEARKKLMKEQGAAWKNVQDKAKAGQIQALSTDAEKLASTAKEIPSLFPEGSLDPAKSAAKPEIWQKRAEFDAAAKNLETWSMKLRDAAAANNTEQTQAIVKDFGRQACGSCHQPFRVPPKQ
jgi:cytochrome c556